MSTCSAVFLDRDGTINAMVYNRDFGFVDSPASPDEFELLPGVSQAIHLINDLGLLPVVVSNQPERGVHALRARGHDGQDAI